MDQSGKFCADRSCEVHKLLPNGLPEHNKFCFMCAGPLVPKRPDEPIVIEEQIATKSHRAIRKYHFWKPTSGKYQKSIIKTDKAIIIFMTGILKSDYDKVRDKISLKFAQTQFGELNLGFQNSFNSRRTHYEGKDFIILNNSIKLGANILSSIDKSENFISIPYKYYLDEEGENLYLPQGDCSRTLIIDTSNFSENNVVTKYDMIILPDGTQSESDFTDPLKRLMISFNLFIPPIRDQVGLPFMDIGNNIRDVLFPLCYGYYNEKRFFKTNKNILFCDSEEKMHELSIDLLKNWLMQALSNDSSIPFHSKFFLLFLTFEKELIQPFSDELFLCLLHTMSSQKYLTLLHNRSQLDGLLEYQTNIISSPLILHDAMKYIAEREIGLLINFLPLYHFIFDSQTEYEVACNKHEFENNEFWGLPLDTEFQCNNKIEISIIHNAIENFCIVDPLLANSIILLSISDDSFPQLLELFPTHILFFVCVLLYRVKKWPCFIEQDYKLRESVFIKFLDKSKQIEHLSMNEEDICQACDVIFKILVVINDEDKTQHCIRLEESNLILRVLARLLSLFDEKCPQLLSEESFHLACKKISNLVTAKTLLKIVGGCLNPDVLNSGSTSDFVSEVANVWDSLYKIHYPESYEFVFAIDELFRKKLAVQDLRTILDALVNLCISYTQIIPSVTLKDSLCNEVMFELNETQTPEQDYELCVRCLVEVPIKRFNLIAEIFTKLFECISKLLKCDPVKYILSTTWWNKFINYCQPKHFEELGHDDAASLIELVISTGKSLVTSFQDQSIKTKDSELIFKYDHNFFNLLQSVLGSDHELSVRTTFDKSIFHIKEQLEIFLQYRRLMNDLKILLDYTQTKMIPQILSYFLELNYEDMSISSLCHHLVILPGSEHEEFLNKPAFVTMLKSLPHLLQSQFFIKTFSNTFQDYFKDNQSELIELEIILDEIWFNSLDFVSISARELLDMNILLSKLNKCFNIEDPVKIEEEIDHLLKAIETVNLNPLHNVGNKSDSLNKVKCYCKLKQVKEIYRIILEVKEAYCMNGKFAIIKVIEDVNLEDKELKSVTEDMVNVGDKLSNCEKLHFKILKQLLACITLFKWVNENLKNQSELDNFTDLALNQCNNSTFEINRITCFKTVCRIFAPFVFESQNETDEETFLMMLETIHYNVKSCEQDESTILEMSNDCTKEIHLNFWKQLKFKHSSIGGGIISKIKNLMSNGDLVLSFEGCLRNIEDMVSIQISRGNQQTDSKVHSLHELKEMLSEVVLIRSESHGDTVGTQFQILLEVVSKLSEILLKLYLSGSVFFRKVETCLTLSITYPCNDIQLIEEDTAFLENEYSNWTTKLKKARDKHYFLNYFTSSQIITIQLGIQLFLENPNRRLDQQLFHLLSFIQEGLLEEDVKINLQQFNFMPHSDTASIASTDSNSSFESKRSSRMSVNEPDSSLDYMLVNSPCTPLDPKKFIFAPPDQFEVPSQVESNDEGDNSLETNISKSQLQSLYEKRTEKILTSLDTLERIFELFGSNLKHQVKRYFPLTFKQGEPNIIFPTNSEMLDCILSIYMPSDDGYDLPLSHEILVCSDATTLEDIDIFLRRSLKVHYYSFIFCIAFIEKLKYKIAVNGICLLNDYLSKLNKPAHFGLFFLCSDETKHSSYMATALGKYKRITPQIHSKEKLKTLVFKRISQRSDFISDKAACNVDPEKCFIRVVTSESAGNGKSLTILRRAEKLKSLSHSTDISSLYTIITIHESEGYEDKAVQILIKSQESDNEYGRIYHFDLVSVSDKQLTPFLFKLLVTRTICDNSKNVWCCSNNNYYMIEINVKSRSTHLIQFLHIFPTWDCVPPNKALDEGNKNIVTMPGCKVSRSDDRELESDIYKRTHAYFLQLKNKLDVEKFIFNPKIHLEFDLKILLEYSELESPSWSEINHFLSFLNNQLIACEKNIYFQSVEMEKSWFGFKKFLIDCLILMSRDFTTPSLRISLQPSTPLNDLLGYSINYDRRWEQKKNPYIFFNEDLQTMTFFGISISKSLNRLDSIDSNRLKEKKAISRQLYNTLKKNQVDLDEDCNSWDRTKMISILANVIGIQSPIDPDPYYVLTIDNLKKMLAIQMRFRSNIPVILMGETGCGKTRLINFMCQLQAKSRDIQNFVIFKIHGEIYKEDIYAHYQKVLALANENVGKNIDTILFFDEVNTSYSIGLIKEIVCDRRIDGERIPNDLRLQFVAACNPYRKHTEAMLNKLTSAGLGMFNTSDKVREHFGNIPLRELVYRVLPLPDSLLPLVWDFGTLDPESERSYIRKIVDINLSPDRKTSSPPLNEAITTVLYSAQMFMRDKDDECSFVSLRDVERTLKVMQWFQQVLPKLLIVTKLSLKTRSLILAIAVCYRAKLRDRRAFDISIIAKFKSPLDKITDATLIWKEIEMFQDFLISLMTIKEHIAKNRSLKENLFMMFVCIQLKIPLFIIGKPGTSKSLAKHIINHSLNGDFNLNGSKIVEYTQIYMRSYQCSQLTTSKEIQNLFQSCQTIQEESAADCVACVVLDEVGLAEDSPSLPLKILHPLLDDGINATNERPNIAFIGLSNWALDPAKMNRGIMLQLEEPKLDDIVATAHSIIKSSKEDSNSLHMLIACIPSIAEGYLELIKEQQAKLSKDYFGLRDFYHLIKLLHLICKQYGTFNNKIMDHVILRNFGGITAVNVVKVFKKFVFNLEDSEIGPESDILSLIKSSLLCKSELTLAVEEKEKQRIERSRYLLLLTENYVALDILFYSEILKNDDKVIFGSSFPLDQEYFGICHTINRIKVFMETGKVVVLTNLSNVYESLYELLNLFYVDILGKSWVDIGIGSQRIKCPVHPDFRLIVIADKNTVFDRFPPPLINRLEKHNLTFSTILKDDIIVKNIIDTLSKWVQDFVTINNNESSYTYTQDKCFIGIQKDTLPFMVYSSIRILGLKGNEKENVGIILDYCKLELLKIASPNSILRLRKCQLAVEADNIFKDYCKLKLFDLANYLHELPNIRKFHNKLNPFLSFITTYSTLLTEFDIVELRTKLNSFSNNESIVSQINLAQFKSEQEFIDTINKKISPIENKGKKRIIVIQCENGQSNFDFISCAKYKVAEIIAEMRGKLNSDFFFVFITKLSFCQDPQYYSSFCGGDWDSVYIDELRDSYHNMLPSFDQLSRISVAEIFDFQHVVSVCYFFLFILLLIDT